jgi:hypothetical protein
MALGRVCFHTHKGDGMFEGIKKFVQIANETL